MLVARGVFSSKRNLPKIISLIWEMRSYILTTQKEWNFELVQRLQSGLLEFLFRAEIEKEFCKTKESKKFNIILCHNCFSQTKSGFMWNGDKLIEASVYTNNGISSPGSFRHLHPRWRPHPLSSMWPPSWNSMPGDSVGCYMIHICLLADTVSCYNVTANTSMHDLLVLVLHTRGKAGSQET